MLEREGVARKRFSFLASYSSAKWFVNSYVFLGLKDAKLATSNLFAGTAGFTMLGGQATFQKETNSTRATDTCNS